MSKRLGVPRQGPPERYRIFTQEVAQLLDIAAAVPVEKSELQ